MPKPLLNPPASERKCAVRVAVVQDGARLHYAVPAALQRGGILDRVFTEWFVKPNSWTDWAARAAMRVSPKRGQRMADRRSTELDARRVITNPWLIVRQLRARKRFASVTDFYHWSSAEVGRWILRHGLGEANALLGFIRNLDPALCAASQQRGLVTVGDQIIAPAIIETREGRLQQTRWPGWDQAGEAEDSVAVAAHEAATWAALDHITCASEYVKRGLVEAGNDPNRVSVIPYPIDVHELPFVRREGRTGPVTIGFVGGVSTRKGAPYFFETARHFDPKQARFVMVGPVNVARTAVEKHRGNVELIGSVPRSEIRSWLEKFDVFFFPSTCEGSAGSLMEAMATGLPVVTSPNSGTVARHGEEGFIAEYDETEKFAGYLRRLIEEPDLRLRMGRAARRRAETFSLDEYAAQLVPLLTHLVQECV